MVVERFWKSGDSGDSPVGEILDYLELIPKYRGTRDPVGICEDHPAKLNSILRPIVEPVP